jgi:hypothetical protein
LVKVSLVFGVAVTVTLDPLVYVPPPLVVPPLLGEALAETVADWANLATSVRSDCAVKV